MRPLLNEEYSLKAKVSPPPSLNPLLLVRTVSCGTLTYEEDAELPMKEVFSIEKSMELSIVKPPLKLSLLRQTNKQTNKQTSKQTNKNELNRFLYF